MVIIVPIALGIAGAWIDDRVFDPSEIVVKGKWANRVNRLVKAPVPPTSWDWLFEVDRIPPSAFLVIEFDDGRQVAGAFAGRSMALTSPASHGLFLEAEWALDASGNVVNEVPGTAGLLIPTADNVRWVRVLHSGDEASQTDITNA